MIYNNFSLLNRSFQTRNISIDLVISWDLLTSYPKDLDSTNQRQFTAYARDSVVIAFYKMFNLQNVAKLYKHIIFVITETDFFILKLHYNRTVRNGTSAYGCNNNEELFSCFLLPTYAKPKITLANLAKVDKFLLAKKHFF